MQNIALARCLLAILCLSIILLCALHCMVSSYLVYASMHEEHHYLSIVQHLMTQNNWILLHDNQGLYLAKPPLQFWVTKVSWLIFGTHDWSINIFNAIFCIGTVIFIYLSSALIWPNSRVYAWLPALMLLGCYYFFHYTQYILQSVIERPLIKRRHVVTCCQYPTLKKMRYVVCLTGQNCI